LPDAQSACDNDGLNEVLIGAIGAVLEPVQLGAGRRAALRARILARARAAEATANPASGSAPDSVLIRARDSGWIDLAPGVRAKLLFTDGRAESYLARIDPGTVVPPHPHPGIEECLVLEGRLEFSDGGHLDAGDYQAFFEGTSHGETRSPGGALLFLRYAEPLSRYLSL
jgi:anti-sigma factor ChrR (cupin superfamily)